MSEKTVNEYKNIIFSSDDDIVKYTLRLFILLGLVLKIIYNPVVTNESEKYGNATMNIISNFIIIFISIFYLIYSNSDKLFYFIIVYNILILGETFILNYYYKEINKNIVPKKYKLWAMFSSLLIIIYTIIFILSTTTLSYGDSIIPTILFISLFILFISLIIQFIILNYLMVDS